MTKKDLMRMYRRELEVVMEMNGLKTMEEAVDAVMHEVYASHFLFGAKRKYEMPKDMDLQHFLKDFGSTLHL